LPLAKLAELLEQRAELHGCAESSQTTTILYSLQEDMGKSMFLLPLPWVQRSDPRRV
jgi:hypothetical protein